MHATPTKPGRPPVGLKLVRYAAASCTLPFFAIGGIDTTNIAAVRDAGARRVAVVRALTQAPDPEPVARALRASLTERGRRWRNVAANAGAQHEAGDPEKAAGQARDRQAGASSRR